MKNHGVVAVERDLVEAMSVVNNLEKRRDNYTDLSPVRKCRGYDD
jgi:hypothetical protein